jgi:hypothetical protein
MNKIKGTALAIVGTLTAALAVLGVTAVASQEAPAPVPAYAGVFNDLYHAADDSGYTAPIKIECGKSTGGGDGRIRYLYKGEGSPSKCGFHVHRIIPGPDQAVRCLDTLPPYNWRYYLTSLTLPSFQSQRCYMQRPI